MLKDLHCHSHYSDGTLSPDALLALALTNGVGTLALTDHDTIAGAVILKELAQGHPISIISGIECSVTLQKKEIHVVGLGIDLKHPKLLQYIENQQRKRLCRAQEIAQKLDAIGFENTFDEVMKLAGHHNLSRSHFAHYLLNVGAVKTKQSAFKLYLGEGAPAYVMSSWLGLSDTIDLIHTLGGQAILAHPLHYKKSTGQLKALLREFKSLGGDGMEVVSGIQSPKDTQRLLQLAQNFDLQISFGSDFHDHKPYRASLGKQSPLPENLSTILDALS